MKANTIISYLTAGLVLAVALGSFALSYSALHGLAIQNGINGSLSYIWPLLIDASLIVFSLAVVNAYLQSESTYKQWGLVGIYTIATIGFNVLHAPNDIQSRIVAAIAPISLFFSFEILMSQLRNSVKRSSLLESVKQLEERFTLAKSKIHDRFTQERKALYSKLETILQEIDNKSKELDKLSVKIDQAQSKLDQLNSEISQAKSVKHSSILHAQQAKFDNDVNAKEERLYNLVNILSVNPDTPVSSIAEQLNVSRPTVYNDLNELEELGRISRNGEGVKVL